MKKRAFLKKAQSLLIASTLLYPATGISYAESSKKVAPVTQQVSVGSEITTGGSIEVTTDGGIVLTTSGSITLTTSGTVEVEKNKAKVDADTKVKLKAIPKNDDYGFKEWDVKDSDDETVSVEADNTFKMPKKDVVINAVFKKKYILKIEPTTGGVIKVTTGAGVEFKEDTKAFEGETVTLNFKPEEGHRLKGCEVRDGEGKEVEVKDNKFKMPESNVTIKAVFEEDKKVEDNSDAGTSGAETPDNGKTPGAEKPGEGTPEAEKPGEVKPGNDGKQEENKPNGEVKPGNDGKQEENKPNGEVKPDNDGKQEENKPNGEVKPGNDGKQEENKPNGEVKPDNDGKQEENKPNGEVKPDNNKDNENKSDNGSSSSSGGGSSSSSGGGSSSSKSSSSTTDSKKEDVAKKEEAAPVKPSTEPSAAETDKKSEIGFVPSEAQKEVSRKVTFSMNSNVMKKDVNGEAKDVKMDAKPFVQKGRVMIPVRNVAEALGLNVSWDSKSGKVIMKSGKHLIEIPVNSNKIIVDGKEYISDVKPVSKDGRIYLTISNLAKALGLQVGKDITWDNQKKEMSIQR